MKRICLLLLAASLCAAAHGAGRIRAEVNPHPRTFCNPVNLPYRFMLIPEGKGVRRPRQSYVLEASHDGKRWTRVADNSGKATDTPHDYVEFRKLFGARYLRIRNVAYTSAPYFSLRGLRVFGVRKGAAPLALGGVTVVRNAEDRCKAVVKWAPPKGAEGYVIRYGTARDKLYGSVRIPDGAVREWEMTGLNRDPGYWFAVDAFNDSGTTRGDPTGVR